VDRRELGVTEQLALAIPFEATMFFWRKAMPAR